eukprot:s5023_g1.t1
MTAADVLTAAAAGQPLSAALRAFMRSKVPHAADADEAPTPAASSGASSPAQTTPTAELMGGNSPEPRQVGATLEAACLCFDRRRPDRGYAYVGAPRVKHHGPLFHMGPVRRTDWLPVNGDPAEEQTWPSALSQSSYSEDEAQPGSTSYPDPEPSASDSDSGSDASPDMSSNVSD